MVVLVLGVGLLFILTSDPASSATTPLSETEGRWARTKKLTNKYLKDHELVPLVILSLMQAGLGWMLWPHWLTRQWAENPIRLILAEVFCTYAMYLLHEKGKKPWKYTSARILSVLSLLTIGYLLGILPFIGEDYWEKKWVLEAAAKAAPDDLSQGPPRNPQGEVIIAPLGSRSERVSSRQGLRYDPENDVIVWDDRGNRHTYTKNTHQTRPLLGPSGWVEFQSNTSTGSVKVLVSH